MQSTTHDVDYVLCECELEALKRFVEQLESQHKVAVARAPGTCLTMVRAEDSLEKQEFFLGEALTTECEVTVDGVVGFGLCLGEEPIRAYCIAVIDALIHSTTSASGDIQEFVEAQRAQIVRREKEEFNQILRTQVDFKLMEQD